MPTWREGALGVSSPGMCRSVILGDDALRTIARELVDQVRRNTTIDWTVKESVRAKLRVIVKRVLRKYGYPPDRTSGRSRTTEAARPFVAVP